MCHERVAFVAAGCQQHRGPEVFQKSQMGIPILYLPIEERADLVIFTHLCVKVIDKIRNLRFGDAVFFLHWGSPVCDAWLRQIGYCSPASLLMTNACAASRTTAISIDRKSTRLNSSHRCISHP